MHDALEAKYNLPAYVYLREVRNATGFDSTRSADAMAIALYRTRGREITGFEFKTSRSDWLRELKDPSKAEEMGKFCDHFFLVIDDDSIAKVEELPTPWGLMLVKNGKVKILKPSQKLEPAPLTRNMFCALIYATMRRFAFDSNSPLVREMIEAEVQRKRDHALSHAEHYKDKFEKLEQRVKEFEEASGVNGLEWGDHKKIGATVQAILHDTNIVERQIQDLRYLAGSAKRIADGWADKLKTIAGDLAQEVKTIEDEIEAEHQKQAAARA